MLPPLPGHRHSVGSKDLHHASAVDQRRTTSEPLSELEEKLKARNQDKRRDSIAAITQHGKAPEPNQQSKQTDAAQQGLANLSLAEKATGKEEKDSKQPTAQPLSKLEHIYVAPSELSFRPENDNCKPQPTALLSAYKPVLLNSDSFGYVTAEAREESDSDSDDDDVAAEYEPYKEDGEVASEYEDTSSAENPIEPEQKEDSKSAGKEKQGNVNSYLQRCTSV